MKKGKKENEEKISEEQGEEVKRRMLVPSIVIIEYWNTIQVNPDNVIN